MKKRKLIIVLIVSLLLILILSILGAWIKSLYIRAEKPVIYLYPSHESVVNVSLECEGTFTQIIPSFATPNTWRVKATPDGKITDTVSGNTFPYLFWEADMLWPQKISEGIFVKGSETERYLLKVLPLLGLNEQETDDFISYWLPRMETGTYNLIYFAGADYQSMAKLRITPAPDTLVRICMVWQKEEAPYPIKKQTLLPSVRRKGFTVVEWGGMELHPHRGF
jgi:hypothetical protein